LEYPGVSYGSEFVPSDSFPLSVLSNLSRVYFLSTRRWLSETRAWSSQLGRCQVTRSFLNDVANKIAIIAHHRLAVFQGTFKDSWAAAKMAEFMAVKAKPR